MRPTKKNTWLFVVIVLFVLWHDNTLAQGCVQCRMAPESNLDGGGQTAQTLNTAILYLMAIPYLLIAAIVMYVYRKPLHQRYKVWKMKRHAKVSQ